MRRFNFVIDGPEALERFESIKAKNHLIDDKEVIELALKRLWDSDQPPSLVYPKIEYKKRLRNILGSSGPYLVEEIRYSWLGFSKGLLRLENCEAFLPLDWFSIVPVSRFSLKTAALGFILGTLLTVSSATSYYLWKTNSVEKPPIINARSR